MITKQYPTALFVLLPRTVVGETISDQVWMSYDDRYHFIPVTVEGRATITFTIDTGTILDINVAMIDLSQQEEWESGYCYFGPPFGSPCEFTYPETVFEDVTIAELPSPGVTVEDTTVVVMVENRGYGYDSISFLYTIYVSYDEAQAQAPSRDWLAYLAGVLLVGASIFVITQDERDFDTPFTAVVTQKHKSSAQTSTLLKTTSLGGSVLILAGAAVTVWTSDHDYWFDLTRVVFGWAIVAVMIVLAFNFWAMQNIFGARFASYMVGTTTLVTLDISLTVVLAGGDPGFFLGFMLWFVAAAVHVFGITAHYSALKREAQEADWEAEAARTGVSIETLRQRDSAPEDIALARRSAARAGVYVVFCTSLFTPALAFGFEPEHPEVWSIMLVWFVTAAIPAGWWFSGFIYNRSLSVAKGASGLLIVLLIFYSIITLLCVGTFIFGDNELLPASVVSLLATAMMFVLAGRMNRLVKAMQDHPRGSEESRQWQHRSIPPSRAVRSSQPTTSVSAHSSTLPTPLLASTPAPQPSPRSFSTEAASIGVVVVGVSAPKSNRPTSAFPVVGRVDLFPGSTLASLRSHVSTVVSASIGKGNDFVYMIHNKQGGFTTIDVLDENRHPATDFSALIVGVYPSGAPLPNLNARLAMYSHAASDSLTLDARKVQTTSSGGTKFSELGSVVIEANTTVAALRSHASWTELGLAGEYAFLVRSYDGKFHELSTTSEWTTLALELGPVVSVQSRSSTAPPPVPSAPRAVETVNDDDDSPPAYKEARSRGSR